MVMSTPWPQQAISPKNVRIHTKAVEEVNTKKGEIKEINKESSQNSFNFHSFNSVKLFK